MTIPQSPRVFISYARSDGEKFATQLRQRLERDEPEITLWQDRARMEGGKDWWKQITDALDAVQFMVLIMTPASQQSATVRKEWRAARDRGVCIYPVVASPNLDFSALPRWMSKTHFYHLDREWEAFTHYLKGPCTAVRVPFMAGDLPDNYTDRPQIRATLRAALLNGENPAPGTAVLHGPGGFGKTTLAQAVCHDDDVLTAYDAGVLWVTLGEHPNILNELTKLYAALTDERFAFIDIEDAAAHVAEKLGENNCLLVIDDVWNEVHLRPFLRGGSGCARLITSRRFEVAAEASKPIEVYEMTPAEAVATLTARLDQPPGDHRPLQQLARRLGEWPLMLELAGAMLRQRILKGDTLQGAVQYLNKALDKRGATAFDRTNAGERNQAIARSLTVSLDQLEPVERQRYVELAIFPDDVDIPLSTLQALWGLDDFDTEETVERLSDLSLLRHDLNAKTIRLHDVVRSYLAGQLADPAFVHVRLIEGWGDPHQLPDAYAWRWIAYHLSKAGHLPTLRALLLDYAWLYGKLGVCEVNALLTDFAFFPDDVVLRRLGRTLRQAAHTVDRDRDQLTGQLLGRLLDDPTPEIQALLEQAKQVQRPPYLRPRTASLRESEAVLRTLAGHIDRVTCVAVTLDGQRAVSASADHMLKVWDLNSGEVLHTLAGHTEWVSSVAVTPDGQRAISASRDKTLKVWDLSSGEALRTLAGHADQVTCVVVTPDGQRAVSASADQTLKVWDLNSGEVLRTLAGHNKLVSSVAVTPDGQRAISASWDNTLKVWDLNSGEALRTLAGHTQWVSSVTVTPDGQRAISASGDSALKVWDLNSGQVLRTLATHTDWVSSVAVTPDGQRVLSTSADPTLKVWDLSSGEALCTLAGHTDQVTSVVVTPDGQRAVSASVDHTFKVWNLATTSGEALRTQADHINRVTSVALTPDGQRALSASWDKTLKVWDLSSGEALRTLTGHTDQVTSVAVTPDGQRALSASWDQKLKVLKVWDLNSGEVLRTLGYAEWGVSSVAVTPDGQRAVSASWDKTLKVWELNSGELLHMLASSFGSVNSSGERVSIHQESHTGWVTSVAVTPDGQRALSASADHTLKVWDLNSGKMLCTLSGHTAWVTSGAITPDGQRAVSASADHTLKVWDLNSGELLRTLTGHTAWVTGVAVTPDGRRAVSASADHTLKVWSLNSGKCLATFDAGEMLEACAIAPDGVTIVTGGRSGRLHFLRFVEK